MHKETVTVEWPCYHVADRALDQCRTDAEEEEFSDGPEIAPSTAQVGSGWQQRPMLANIIMLQR